ncbi:hypothetical protein IM543_04335 [Massilia sp. UMI-21]|nr:hypothetical protein IM543_04335 [Massilia sp. UMI-21]
MAAWKQRRGAAIACGFPHVDQAMNRVYRCFRIPGAPPSAAVRRRWIVPRGGMIWRSRQGVAAAPGHAAYRRRQQAIRGSGDIAITGAKLQLVDAALAEAGRSRAPY